MVNEHKSVSSADRGRHVFHPLVWTRLVRQHGEFAAIIYVQNDCIHDIVLMHQPVEGERFIQHFLTYEELEDEVKRINRTTGIRINDSEMAKMKKFWDIYDEAPELTYKRTGRWY